MLSLVLAQAPLVSHGLVQMLVVIVILGVCLWLVNTYVPMAAPIKTLLTVVVVLIVVLMLLRLVGIF